MTVHLYIFIIEFWCDVCEVKLVWKSKYERHLASVKHHQQFQLTCMTTLPFEDEIMSHSVTPDEEEVTFNN